MPNMDEPEGATQLDPDEMEGIRFKHVTVRSQLDHLEQANIQKGLRWLSRNKRGQILSEAFLCQLHKQLFSEVWSWAGTFRKTEKNIGTDPARVSVELRTLLDDMRYWIEHQTYAPHEMALRFHHRLVYIHLFPNGNGRHARIIADYILIKLFKEKPIDWAGGHDLQTMNERRIAYIHALRQADKNDYKALLEFAP